MFKSHQAPQISILTLISILGKCWSSFIHFFSFPPITTFYAVKLAFVVFPPLAVEPVFIPCAQMNFESPFLIEGNSLIPDTWRRV